MKLTVRCLFLVFFNYMNLKIVEINRVDEAVLREPRLVMSFEICNCRVKPDRLAQVESIADLIKRMEYLAGPGSIFFIAYNHIFYKPVVFYYFSP